MTKPFVVEMRVHMKPLKENIAYCYCFKTRAITDVGALNLAIDYLAKDNQRLKKNYEAATEVICPQPKGVTIFDIADRWTIKVINIEELEKL